MSAIAVPVKDEAGNPGLYIPSLNRTIALSTWREDDVYDTIETDNAPAAGASYPYFNTIALKLLQHTNLRTQGRIRAKNEIIIYRIGVLPNQAVGNVMKTDRDIIKAAYAAVLHFDINDRQVAEGPLVKFQSGYGVTGSTTQTDTGVVTIGVPSAAAAPMLMVAQPVDENDEISGYILFPNNAWLAGGASMPTFDNAGRMCISLYLRGFVTKALAA